MLKLRFCFHPSYDYCFLNRSGFDKKIGTFHPFSRGRNFCVHFDSFIERMEERENVREALTAIDLGLTDC